MAILIRQEILRAFSLGTSTERGQAAKGGCRTAISALPPTVSVKLGTEWQKCSEPLAACLAKHAD